MAPRKQNIVGTTLIPPEAIIRVYRRELSGNVRAMIKDYQSLLTIYKDKDYQMAMDADTWLTTDIQDRLDKLGKKWSDAFAFFAQKASKRMIAKVLKNTDLQLKSALADYVANKKWELIAKTIPTPLKQVIKAHVAENVNLIKSIANQYHERIAGTLYRAITGEGAFNQLKRDFVKYGRMEINRANLIASDQVHKTFTTIAVKRMESTGITRYKWVHDHPETPRPYHMTRWDGVSGVKDGRPNGLNGFIFDADHLPVIEPKSGIRGWPGQLPYCRCRIAPVFDLLEETKNG